MKNFSNEAKTLLVENELMNAKICLNDAIGLLTSEIIFKYLPISDRLGLRLDFLRRAEGLENWSFY